MRIGIEGQRIFRKKKHGMDFVAIETIKNLLKIDTNNEYFVFVNEREDQSVLPEADNLELVYLKPSPYPIWEQKHLSNAIRQYKLDLLHCTSNTAPLGCDVPLFITLHDIIYMEKLHFKEGSWYQRLGNLYRRWNVPRAVEKAVCLFTVSQFEQKRIMQQFKLPEDKVVVTYNGIGSHFRQLPIEEADKIRIKYGLPEKYILFLGNTDPKKNLRGVIQAIWQLEQQNQLEDHQLVMPDFGEKELAAILQEYGASSLMNKIHLTGYIPNTDLPAIYNRATLFLYPSLRESFGIPILEAMACACPVITSNTSSMPEVAGDAAMIIDPHKPLSIAEACARLLSQEKLRAEFIKKGLSRYPLFSYANSAKLILDTYKKLA